MNKELGIRNKGMRFFKSLIHDSCLPAGKALFIIRKRAGQSLIEILIGLAIGGLLIGTASLGIAFVLRSSTASQRLQSSLGLTQGVVDGVRSISSASWQDIYNLTKGTSTAYFINASGTELFIIEGKEGILGDEIVSGLVGHWRFDEATSSTSTITYDASGNNNNGVLTNGTLRATSTCKVSHCLSFDGVNDYVVVNSMNNIPTGTSPRSVAFWVYPNGTGGQYMVSWGGGADGNEWGVFIDTSPTRLLFDFWNAYVQFDSSTFQFNNWNHIAATYNGTNNKLYVNGVEMSQILTSGSMGSTDIDPVTIGQRATGGSRFSGKIDDVRIYNRAFSADEVQRLYNSSVFTRYFSVENVSRDSAGDIVSFGGDDDPSTQKITVVSEWPGRGDAVGRVTILDYITRWQNTVFNQADWSGGYGQEGPLTSPNDRFSSSTNISIFTPGFIKIEGL